MADITGDNANKVQGEYKHPEFSDMTHDQIMDQVVMFDIDHHLISLVMKEPFYGNVIRSLHKNREPSIPTAGVVCKDDTFYLYYNEKFLAPYNDSQIRGIMMHEALHLILQHTTTRRYEPFNIWNWAADLAINGSIPRNLLPNIGLIPGERPNTTITSNHTQEQIERINRIANLIESLPNDLSSEEYFGILMDNQDIQEMQKEGEEAVAAAISDSMDDHDGWAEGLSDTQREYMAEKGRQVVKAAVEQADSKNSWGSVPAHMREEIRKIVNGEIDWRSLLRRFTGQQQRADRLGSIYRANRKYPGIHAGFSRDYRPSIGVFLDQSGSVSDHALELFFAELPGLSRHADFTIFNFDTSVDESSCVKWKKGSVQSSLVRTRCGGTDFDAITSFLEGPQGRRHRFEAVIILTDGGAGKPKPARGHRRCWILEPGTELAFGSPDAKDVVIKLKSEKKSK